MGGGFGYERGLHRGVGGLGLKGLVYKMEIYDRDMVASFSLHTGNN